MIKFTLTLGLLCFFSLNVSAANFERVTCSILNSKSDSSPSVITAIKLGEIRYLNKDEMSKFGIWNQETDSNEFIYVEVYINDGSVNKSLYRVVNGTLHQSFPSRDGQYAFRRIIPAIAPKVGRYDHVNVKGASLYSTLLNNISCEKDLF
ncbi:hypothetical protein [Moritella viscosa]|jgi:hypothetical protein|uniref:hypothetical protein n=1 Tax=Moritella viscosa TaxID=80854 RepID=UPI00094C8CCF|nr:hypothetical protein [Moritella viscosa]